MIYNDNDLKLIYILKIGYNSNEEGLYEFIFSSDDNRIDIEGWCWDLSPAVDNALPPTNDYIEKIINLKTKTFDLFCLHESVDREYMHGYHTIHALGYEIESENNNNNKDGHSSYEDLFENNKDELPLLVFHYGMTLEKITDMLTARNITLKKGEFIETSSIKL